MTPGSQKWPWGLSWTASDICNFVLFILKLGTGTTFLETCKCAAASMATAYLTNDPIWWLDWHVEKSERIASSEGQTPVAVRGCVWPDPMASSGLCWGLLPCGGRRLHEDHHQLLDQTCLCSRKGASKFLPVLQKKKVNPVVWTLKCTSVLPDRYWYYNLDTGTVNLDFYSHKSEPYGPNHVPTTRQSTREQ